MVAGTSVCPAFPHRERQRAGPPCSV